jgi:hypothetical protein
MLLHRPVRLSMAALGAMTALMACASSHVLVGTARAPISPDQVKVYMNPPPVQYEQIAILNTSSRASFSFTAQGKTDKVIERLKDEAAKLGANGILLQGIGDQQSGSVGVGAGGASGHVGLGFGSSVGTYQKTGNGLAIYVPPN